MITTSAKVIADSIANSIRLRTLELCYPRFIHSEFMTHRMFSRNASSSRAIPIEKMIKQVQESPAMPVHWGKNQSGMQAGEEFDPLVGQGMWMVASHDAVHQAGVLNKKGYHKQVVNRILEPYQFIKVIVTATEWGNFFKLRLHPDAQPEIFSLAEKMKEAMQLSEPTPLIAGEWHLPYVTQSSGSIEDDIKCSVARCARVSYNNHDNSSPDIEKDIKLADRLLESGHMSPLEHQLTPMLSNKLTEFNLDNLEGGVTHVDRSGNLWSGNMRGWIQYRQLI